MAAPGFSIHPLLVFYRAACFHLCIALLDIQKSLQLDRRWNLKTTLRVFHRRTSFAASGFQGRFPCMSEQRQLFAPQRGETVLQIGICLTRYPEEQSRLGTGDHHSSCILNSPFTFAISYATVYNTCFVQVQHQLRNTGVESSKIRHQMNPIFS